MTGPQRAHVAALCRELLPLRAQLDYPPGDQRTARDNWSWTLDEKNALLYLRRSSSNHLQFDCSEFVPWVLRCACGRWPFSWAGWTGAHLQWWHARGWQVYEDPSGAGVGAIVIFGPGDGHHEAVVTGDPYTHDPVLTSHGRPGLDVVRLSAMQASQTAAGHPGVRFLSVTHL